MEYSTLGHFGLSSDVTCLEDMLAVHPTYMDMFLRFHHALLSADGPLPEHFRHYIAIMAASRHQCSYIVEEQKEAYLHSGGCQEWLDGIQYAPKKLQALHTTNKILAHRPWLYSKSHVQHLLKNSWSLSELTQAVCILAYIHALCSIVQGSGIEASHGEPPLLQAEMLQNCSSGSPSSRELSVGGLEVLVDRMKSIALSESFLPEEQKLESFEALKNQTAHISGPDLKIIDKKYLYRYAHFSSEPEYSYVDFGRGLDKGNSSAMKSQDCSWEKLGFSLISDLYNGVGEILDQKFQTAYNMTYFTCGNKTHIDTHPFRRGVWNYLHCLYGIRHDYYDYRQVNRLIEPNLKTFLKTVACYPERLLPSEHTPPLMKDFLHSEKIHVLILVLEARLQSELLFALRSIEQYLL